MVDVEREHDLRLGRDAVRERRDADDLVGAGEGHLRLFLATGILGGYTTFSAFSLDAALLYDRNTLGLAALYVLGTVVLAVGGLFAGLALARQLSWPRGLANHLRALLALNVPGLGIDAVLAPAK